MSRVIVIGSINQDVTVTVDRFPQPGETLYTRSLAYRLGGKGANQAAAAAHAGATTLFVGRVGADAAGPALATELAGHGVDVGALIVDGDVTTGSAFITVAASGENTILIDAGANGRVAPTQAEDALTLTSGDVVVLQGEVPPQVNERAVAWARQVGAVSVLNVAPVYDVAPEVLVDVEVLVVNETEAGLLLDREPPRTRAQAQAAAHDLVDRGPSRVVVTMGGSGAVWSDGACEGHVPALDLGPVVDTTGAGDASVGALAAALAAGLDFERAVSEGVRAGSTAVLAPGAAASYSAIKPIEA